MMTTRAAGRPGDEEDLLMHDADGRAVARRGAGLEALGARISRKAISPLTPPGSELVGDGGLEADRRAARDVRRRAAVAVGDVRRDREFRIVPIPASL